MNASRQCGWRITPKVREECGKLAPLSSPRHASARHSGRGTAGPRQAVGAPVFPEGLTPRSNGPSTDSGAQPPNRAPWPLPDGFEQDPRRPFSVHSDLVGVGDTWPAWCLPSTEHSLTP